ncbi:MAG: AraC family transcriptional regulator ligand-binding domain-containing protein [Saprospiraceae bacterium]
MRVRMSIIRNIVFGSARFGANPKMFWEKLDLPPEQYEQSDLMVDWIPGAKVWDIAANLTNNPQIGLQLGELTTEISLGLVGHLMQTSPTLGAACEQVARFNLSFSEMFYYHTHRNTHEFIMEFAPTEPYLLQYPDSARHSVEISMTGILHVAHLLTGKKVLPLYTCFAYPHPVADLREYRRLLGDDLRFNQPKSCVVFKISDADLPVIGYNAELLRMFEQLAHDFIQRHQNQQNAVALVKKTILDQFCHQLPQLPEVAERLNMTSRSLQRKLHDEGVSFQQIMEEIRSEMAVGLVKRKQFTANEIAYMLGYADPTSFRRAFKRWTGANPRALGRA